MGVRFSRYSQISKEFRDRTSYLNFKRLFLRISVNVKLFNIFNPFSTSSTLYLALRYFDIERESHLCFYSKMGNHYTERDYVDALADFFCCLYQDDRSLFQTIFSFIIKESWYQISDRLSIFKEELNVLGYILDGYVLKTTSGNVIIEQKVRSYLDDELYKIDPELILMRNGAIDALLSNSPDKARHVASSSRALINTLLKKLVPTVQKINDESEIYLRIKELFKESDSTNLIIKNTVSLIQALNKVQSKADHSKIDSQLAYFIFELTDKLVYFILIYKN